MKQEKKSADTEKFRVFDVDIDGDLAMNIKSQDISVSDKDPNSNEIESLSDYGFEIGDMVWGKVKSHPWWPGHIYSEALASTSVRRSKREGCLLVAFFGDSSYGWFDLAELVPFDSNFTEKSKQTSSRTFVKAVAEAVDEASRRSGLGLSCRCRNAYNFRPTNVKGYFAVDVDGYEPGGVYSEIQIAKARDGFRSREIIGFIKKLALAPTSDEHVGIHFVKNKATVFAYRKAVFEEFDETYAQAFGYQPVRPSPGQAQDVAPQSRAPLSGRLVMAETSGKGKSPAKLNKSKDQAKNDRYLFKRRDESNESKTHQVDLGKAPSSPQSIHAEASLSIAVEVKENLGSNAEVDPTIRDVKKEKKEKSGSNAEADPTIRDVKKEKKEKSGSNAEAGPRSKDVKKEKKEKKEKKGSNAEAGFTGKDVIKEKSGSNGEVGPTSMDVTIEKSGSSIEVGHTGRDVTKENLNSNAEGGATSRDEKKEKSLAAAVKSRKSRDFTKEKSGSSAETGPTRRGVKKEKLRSSAEAGSKGKDVTKEKLRSVVEVGPTRIDVSCSANEMPSLIEPGGAMIDFKDVQVSPPGFNLVEDIDQPLSQPSKVELQETDKKPKAHKRPIGELGPEKSLPLAKMIKKKKKKFNNKEVTISDSTQKEDDVRGASNSNSAGAHQIEPQVQKLLSDLKSVALNPFHNVERNSNSAIIRAVFLKFRSLVYQKSLPAENQSTERDNQLTERDAPSSKPVVVKPDGPIKSGLKRGPSDRQEEMAVKKKKKINDIKSLAEEKKVTALTLKDSKPVNKSEHVKKLDPDPTMLVMKFPPQGTLPSINELKAKFARFGPIDHSGTRVFWKSSSCRVVYLQKMHARAAYKFAVGSSNLFGNANVRCNLRDMSAVGGPEAETGAPQLREPAAPVVPQAGGVQQLKSCLKKSNGDDVVAVGGGNGGGNGRGGNPRVKFKLGGGEESSNSFGDNVLSTNITTTNTSTNSIGMDFNSKNFQKSIIPPSPLPPILPLPPQYARPPNSLEAAPQRRNTQNFNMQNNVDISQQMMSLLKRCNDVVANVTSFLGYVPYHPL